MKLDDWYGQIPENWEVLSVAELVDKAVLFPPKDGNHGNIHPKNNDFVDDGIPFIMASDVINGKIDYKNCKKISRKQAETLKKGFAKKGDVLLTHKATIGRTAIVYSDLEYIMLTPQVTYYRVKNTSIISNLYLAFLFRSPKFRDILMSFAGGGSTRDYIGITKQLELPILIPPFSEQLLIVEQLKYLDDKISLLRRQNETLEQIAQTIFRHWFVDFEFPDEHGNPYKSSGGRFVSSELGDIPEDWEVGRVEDCISNVVDYRGKTPKKLGMEWSEDGIPAFSAKNVKNGLIVREDTMNFGSEELYDTWMKDEIKNGDILLTSEAPLGELFYLVDPPKFILSQRLFALRAKEVAFSPYLYYYLKSPQGQLLIKKRATGSTVVGIRQSELREVEVLIPSMRVIGEASRIYANILSKIDRNCSFVKNITEIRDILLPKLMSGKIRVK